MLPVGVGHGLFTHPITRMSRPLVAVDSREVARAQPQRTGAQRLTTTTLCCIETRLYADEEKQEALVL